MSRSYYKYPSFKDYSRSYTRWAKRQASKTVRKNWNIDDGCNYKKIYPRYDIFDFRFTYYYDHEVEESQYAENNKIYKIPKKNFVKSFRRNSIRYRTDLFD